MFFWWFVPDPHPKIRNSQDEQADQYVEDFGEDEGEEPLVASSSKGVQGAETDGGIDFDGDDGPDGQTEDSDADEVEKDDEDEDEEESDSGEEEERSDQGCDREHINPINIFIIFLTNVSIAKKLYLLFFPTCAAIICLSPVKTSSGEDDFFGRKKLFRPGLRLHLDRKI